MIFFAAGDPGVSRAIMRIIMLLEKQKLDYTVLDYGYLGKELPVEQTNRKCSLEDAAGLIRKSGAFVFGSSVSITIPLELARYAKTFGVPVVHVLDNWSSYLKRLRTDGLPPLIPDVYAVPDEIAMEGAIADGVPRESIVVTGHPGMGHVIIPTEANAGRREIHVAFISEPFSLALGEDINKAGHPGFTEDAVLAAFCDTMCQFGERVFIHILPHPKQDLEAVERTWASCCKGLEGCVCQPGKGRDALASVDGVAGMSSSLLYEAWHSGIPCLCLQPECKAKDMRRFSLLDGIFYADTYAGVPKEIVGWFELCAVRNKFTPRPEAETHKRSAENLITIIKKLKHHKPISWYNA